jgi:hypothetical protein
MFFDMKTAKIHVLMQWLSSPQNNDFDTYKDQIMLQ